MNTTKLTEYDYAYLNGDMEVWTMKYGAAWNVVAEWCHNRGYGTWDEPTERGKTAMMEYEVDQ